jgi:hypothetical protein
MPLNQGWKHWHVLDYFVEVARGAVPGCKAVQKFGRNDDIDSASGFEDIWAGGGTRAYLSSAETMDVVSDSANDTSAGTGTQTVVIEGLNSDYEEISETVTMNGVSAVTTSNSFLRVHRMYAAASGSVGTNDGQITADPTTSGSGSRQALIAAGDGQTLISHYTVPANYDGFIVGGQISISSSVGGTGVKEAICQFMRRDLNGSWRLQQQMGARIDGAGTTADINFTVPISMGEKTDLRWRADVDNNNTSVYVQYNVLLIHHDYQE